MDSTTTNVVESKADEVFIIFDQVSGYLHCFNPKDNTWTQLHKKHDEMKYAYFSAVSVEDFIYVLMESKAVFRIECLDKNAKWERMPDMINEHGYCPPATVLNNLIYVIGGHSGLESKTAEKYNTESNTWTKIPNKLRKSNASDILVFEDKIYSFGGYSDREGDMDQVDLFLPENDIWINIGFMTVAKSFLSSVAVGDGIYVLGGIKKKDLNTVEKYDPYKNRWTTLKPMLTARYWFRALAIENHIYAVGGLNYYPGSMERYSITDEKWEMIELPEGMKIKIEESVKIKTKIKAT